MTEKAREIRILAVDTASLTGSVALASGEVLVAESLLNVRSTHSEKLLQQIDLLLGEAGWTLRDIEVFAVVVGPGSFTGLRIGLATVKGLAQTLNKPVVGVSALEASAVALGATEYPVCAFLDARKKEVYSQMFSTGPRGPAAIDSPRVIDPGLLLSEISEKVAFIGDGVPVYLNRIKKDLGELAILPPLPLHQRRAGQVAWLAYQRWLDDQGVNPADIIPLYIRPSDAELNLPARPAVR